MPEFTCPHCGTLISWPQIQRPSNASHESHSRFIRTGMQGFMRQIGLWIILIIIAVLALSRFLEQNATPTPLDNYRIAGKTPSNYPSVISPQFHLLEPGMTYQQVETIIGHMGEKSNEGYMGDAQLDWYFWRGATVQIDVIFMNGRLISKFLTESK